MRKEQMTINGINMKFDPQWLYYDTPHENFYKYRRQESAIRRQYKRIINNLDFMALQIDTNDKNKQSIILHKSTRPGEVWQLSYIDKLGAVMHEIYNADFTSIASKYSPDLLHILTHKTKATQNITILYR